MNTKTETKTKDIFDRVEVGIDDIFSRIKLDLLDKVDLDPEDKILYSKELIDLIKDELRKELAKLPIGQIAADILEKAIKNQEKSHDSVKSDIASQIEKAKSEIRNELFKVNESQEKLSDKLKEKYADLRNEIMSGSVLPQVVGGYVLTVEEEDGTPRGQPTRLKFPNGTVTNNNDGTYSVSGISSYVSAYRAITANRTLDSSDHLVNCTSGTFTVTLPTAIGIQGREYIIKNSGAGTITLATTSSQTIDDETTQTLLPDYCIVAVSDGANWIII